VAIGKGVWLLATAGVADRQFRESIHAS
jgi:hypothetical protein